MNKQINIGGSSKIDYNIEKCIKPEVIYIPLENKKGDIYKHLVKEGDYIYKGDVIAVNEKLDFPIHSPVSGYAVCGSSKIIGNGKKIKCVVVENDFKEKYKKSKMIKKEITSYKKEDFIEALRVNGISDGGESNYPVFIKYKMDNIKCLLVNAAETEPFVSCDKALIHNYSESILETIDNILEIMNIPKAIITVKENNIDSIKNINKYIGTFPNIKLKTVDKSYLNGWERFLIKNTLGIEYNKYPSEKGIVVSDVSTIYAIYEMLEYNRPLTERIITIEGPGIKEKKNVKVKIGTLASEVINNIDGYKDIKNPLFIVGGPMKGKSVPTDDVIITKDVNCLLVIDDHFEKNLPCIKCGKCIEVCPSKILPIMIMNNIDNINNLKKLKSNKCIECGLCSYICPSKIEVREFVRIAKEKVNDE